jgi:hypothetical protein
MSKFQPPSVQQWIDAGCAAIPFGSSVRILAGEALDLEETKRQRRELLLRLGWVEEDMRRLEAKVADLMNELPPAKQPKPADFAALALAAIEASRRTFGSDKRRALRNAVINSFDKALYEQGVARRILQMLEHLEYHDIEFLRRLSERPEQKLEEDRLPAAWSGHLDWNAVQQLQSQGAVMVMRKKERQGVMSMGGPPDTIRPTSLGLLLLDFLKEPTEEPTAPPTV